MPASVPTPSPSRRRLLELEKDPARLKADILLRLAAHKDGCGHGTERPRADRRDGLPRLLRDALVTDHVVFVSNRPTCEHCGERIEMPLGPIDWVIGVTQAFVNAHRGCKKGDSRAVPLCRWQTIKPDGHHVDCSCNACLMARGMVPINRRD